MKILCKSIFIVVCLVCIICFCSCVQDPPCGLHLSSAEDNITDKITEESTEPDPETIELKPNEPRDIINGEPLYIEYIADYVETPEQAAAEKFYHKIVGANSEKDEIVISYGGFNYVLSMYNVQYDQIDKSKFWLNNCIFNIYWHSLSVIHYTAYLSPWEAYHALLITDWQNNIHSYLISKNNLDGSLNVVKTDISRRRHSNDSIKYMNKGAETINIKFYKYDTEKDPEVNGGIENYKYTAEDIPVENFVDEFIRLMFQHMGIRADDIWYEGDRICLDLNFYTSWDNGSMGTAIRVSEMILTLASFPNVEKIEFLVDGMRGVEGGHFNFYPIFDANDLHIY